MLCVTTNTDTDHDHPVTSKVILYITLHSDRFDIADCGFLIADGMSPISVNPQIGNRQCLIPNDVMDFRCECVVPSKPRESRI